MRNTAFLGTVRILRKVLKMRRRDNSVSLWPFVMTRLTKENTGMTTDSQNMMLKFNNNNNEKKNPQNRNEEAILLGGLTLFI